MERNDCFYASYPDGYRKLVKKIIPFYLRPAKDMMMKLLIKILLEG